MQTKLGNGGRAGMVQWVVPPPARQKRATNSRDSQQANHYNNNGSRQQTTTHNSSCRQATTLDDSRDYNNPGDRNLHDSGICDDLSFGRSTQYSNHNNSDNSSRPIIDLSVCRTISTFVEVHLRDLSERKQQINQARSKLISAKLSNNHKQHQRESPVSIYMAPKDDIKFKVRDEQTKAIESIKQLTNYLKELSYLKRHCDSSIDEDVVTKLSELRTKIIQALNDFVLSNSDIDVPILDSKVYEHDLCIDARKVSKEEKEPTISDKVSNSSNPSIETGKIVKKHSTRGSSPLPSIHDYSDQSESLVEQAQKKAACINLEERMREVRKLDKDTVELRRLFSEFFNLIREQGEKLDNIEENIVISKQGVAEGQHNLKKAAKGLTIIMPVTCCMAGALIGGPLGMVIGGKLGGITVGCVSSLIGLISSYGLQQCVIPSQKNRIKLD